MTTGKPCPCCGAPLDYQGRCRAFGTGCGGSRFRRKLARQPLKPAEDTRRAVEVALDAASNRARHALADVDYPDGDVRGQRLHALTELAVRYQPHNALTRDLDAGLPRSLWDDREFPEHVVGVLTCDHARSSQGLPVLLGPGGPLGPAEVASISWDCGTLPLVTAAVSAGYHVSGSGYDRRTT